MSAPARKAVFPRGDQLRRSMLGKVHLAKKELGLDEDDYRAVVQRVTGERSAGDCNFKQLDVLIAELKRLGFVAKKGKPKPADHPAALKARALWISLYHLNAIANPAEQALEAFVCRQLGVERMQWASQALMHRAIEALKAIAARHGWDQSIEGLQATMVPIVLRRRLVTRLVDLLKEIGLASEAWGERRTVREFSGIDQSILLASASELDVMAASLGKTLREAKRVRP